MTILPEYKELMVLFFPATMSFEFHILPSHPNYKPPRPYRYSDSQKCLIWSVVFKGEEYEEACTHLYENIRNSFKFTLNDFEKDITKRFLSEESAKHFGAFIENLQRNNPV